MAVYNTNSDAANTAVRAFLTSVGEFYYKKSLNNGSGTAKKVWAQIQSDFGNTCAYCGSAKRLQIEHLVMFNRSEYGLHHPGNVVPVCAECNKRGKDTNKKSVSWLAQLATKCGGETTPLYNLRKTRIDEHIRKYECPVLSQQEHHAIKVIAESLYENIKAEADKSLRMYQKLDEAFVHKQTIS